LRIVNRGSWVGSLLLTALILTSALLTVAVSLVYSSGQPVIGQNSLPCCSFGGTAGLTGNLLVRVTTEATIQGSTLPESAFTVTVTPVSNGSSQPSTVTTGGQGFVNLTLSPGNYTFQVFDQRAYTSGVVTVLPGLTTEVLAVESSQRLPVSFFILTDSENSGFVQEWDNVTARVSSIPSLIDLQGSWFVDAAYLPSGQTVSSSRLPPAGGLKVEVQASLLSWGSRADGLWLVFQLKNPLSVQGLELLQLVEYSITYSVVVVGA
jgi:hypothetical protein